MAKKFKKSYLFFIVISIISALALVGLLISLYKLKNNSVLLSIYSCWISIVASILFSTVISFIVQLINDFRAIKDILSRKELIRSREIGILTNELSNFLSLFHDNEVILIDKYKIKDSLLNKQLNINIIKDNMHILSKKLSRASKQNKVLIENYLLISDNIKIEYNKVIELLNKKRLEFENINIDLNFEVFTKTEIESLKLIPVFVNEYNENIYTLIESLLQIVTIYDIQINFQNNKFLTLMALLLSDSLKSDKT